MQNFHPYGLSGPSPTNVGNAVGGGVAASLPLITGHVSAGNIISTIGGGILTGSIFAGPAAPVVAAIGGLVALGGQIFNAVGIGVPDLKKVQSSKDANDVEAQMAQIQTWWNGVEHTTANQQTAVTAWYQLWNQLTQLCGDPNLGSAGQNCIADRQRGGKWDWFAMHLDPILNTPLTDSGTVTGDVTSIFSSSGMLIVGGLLIAVAVFSSDN